MKKLYVCLIVFLVAISLSLTLVPNGTSQVSTVKIVSYSYYIDSLGYLVVVGEIQNIGPNIIDHVLVTGTLTTTDDVQVNSGVNAWGFQLTPNQKAPFYLEFHSQSNTEGTFYGLTISDISLEISEAPATAEYQYPDLAITSQHPTQTTVGEYFVDCQIKNTGSHLASGTIMSVAFYNSTGQVVAVGYSNQTDIAPGDTVFLRAGAFDLNQTDAPSEKKIANYNVLLQVSGPLLEGSAPVPVASPAPGPVVIETPSPISGSDNGNGSGATGSEQNLTLAIGIVVVIVIVVAALLLLTRRQRPKQTGETQSSSKSLSRKSKAKRK